MRRLAILLVLQGCVHDEPALVPEPIDRHCTADELRWPGTPLSLERGRTELTWAELRRHLRMEEALDPGFVLREADTAAAAAIERGDCGTLVQLGRLVFEHEHTFADGLSAPFLRVQNEHGGPETQTCRSCHWRGGPAGAGSVLDNALLLGDGDRISTADARNPPPLLGLKMVEAIAAEMTIELQAQRDAALEEGAGTYRLSAKGVDFGTLQILGDGALQTSGLDGIDPDLVVKPFGWKGNFATLEGFVRQSVRDHFGSDLLSDAHLVALQLYLTSLEPPTTVIPKPPREFESSAEPLPAPTAFDYSDQWADGLILFDEIGCGICHRPLTLDDPNVTIGAIPVALPLSPGAEVALFSDLKRHDLGEDARHVHRQVPAGDYLTRRLWGLNGSGPYFHDGRAPFLDHAIAAHGGDAAFARAGFDSLDEHDKGRLRLYLMSLRRPFALVASP